MVDAEGASAASPTQRVLVTGAFGMLGQDLCERLRDDGHEVVSTDHHDLDVTNQDHLNRIIKQDFGLVTWVVNCAAYTAVDKAEEEVMAAHRLNAQAPGLLAFAAKEAGARFLHISTDFVFDGNSQTPYHEASVTNPQSVYGKTKLQGEQNAIAQNPSTIVCRTAWLYGASGKSFPRTMIQASLGEKPLRVVADQTGCPTYTRELARVISELILLGAAPGIYHTAGSEPMSWHELAVRAIRTYRQYVKDERPVEIAAITTADYPTPARRPPYSVMSFAKCESLGIAPMAPVDESLLDFVSRLRLESPAS